MRHSVCVCVGGVNAGTVDLSSDSHDCEANILLPKSSFQSLFLNLLFNYKEIFNFPGAGNQQCSPAQYPQPVSYAAIHQSCVCTNMHLTWCVGRNLLSFDIWKFHCNTTELSSLWDFGLGNESKWHRVANRTWQFCFVQRVFVWERMSRPIVSVSCLG